MADPTEVAWGAAAGLYSDCDGPAPPQAPTATTEGLGADGRVAVQSRRRDGRTKEQPGGDDWQAGFRFLADPDNGCLLAADDGMLFGDRNTLDHTYLTAPSKVGAGVGSRASRRVSSTSCSPTARDLPLGDAGAPEVEAPDHRHLGAVPSVRFCNPDPATHGPLPESNRHRGLEWKAHFHHHLLLPAGDRTAATVLDRNNSGFRHLYSEAPRGSHRHHGDSYCEAAGVCRMPWKSFFNGLSRAQCHMATRCSTDTA